MTRQDLVAGLQAPEGGAVAFAADRSDGVVRRQPRLPNAVLGMWLFLFAELMLFCGLVSGYLVLRGQTPAWPPLGQPRLPVALTAVNTAVLLASGLAMAASVPMLRAGRRQRVMLALGSAWALGALFLAIQGYEWSRLVAFGLTSRSSLYGALFYMLVGAHGLHVCAALTALGAMLVLVARGRVGPANPAGLAAMRLYWSFVVLLWPVLYALVYLL